jgi:hypothetical protein
MVNNQKWKQNLEVIIWLRERLKCILIAVLEQILSMDSGSLRGKQLLSKSDSGYCCLGMLQVMAET